MSLLSWRLEFYPVEAVDAPHHELINHALTKWRGLIPVNLEKHNVHQLGGGEIIDVDGHYLNIDGDSCSLCIHYYNHHSDPARCVMCPLSIVRDGIPCDRTGNAEEHTPYHTWIMTGDPNPMIRFLEKALSQVGEAQ